MGWVCLELLEWRGVGGGLGEGVGGGLEGASMGPKGLKGG